MTKPIVLLLSGPNHNLFGKRDPEVYGSTTLEQYEAKARAVAEANGHVLEHLQSNSESKLVEAVQAARERCKAIVINPGAFTHYSWALHDALQMFDGRIVEVHISNVARREAWRHTSVVSPVATATIAGLGGRGYEVGVEFACSNS